MNENSPAGLFVLQSEVTVTVTREENHQQQLARYPVAPGASRQVTAELGWCVIGSGKYRGERAIEVRLDGNRVGELTHAMSQRYAEMVETVTTRGYQPGCEAHIYRNDRGFQIDLRMPRPDSVIGLPPSPQRTGSFTPQPAQTTAFVPEPPVTSSFSAETGPTAHFPAPPPRTPASLRTAAATGTKPAKGKRPFWIGAAVVVGVLALAVATGQSDEKPSPAANPVVPLETSYTSATPIAESSTAIPTATTPTTSTTQVPPPPPLPQQNPPPPPNTPSKRSTPTSTKKTEAPPPPPAPPANKCDPNYSGCVPVASDVDCAGGSGNGPAYVSGPIQVTGKDIYGLDNDKDGIACE